jgi:hypothetical protein
MGESEGWSKERRSLTGNSDALCQVNFLHGVEEEIAID